ncbi:MAG: DUF4160 domain-containing protein [Caldilineaceae bacterium]|nr:DUF4160 domain-containing protein [Caldilineaceae bacterium]
MPVVLRVKGYKFWFYEADLDEPCHVHVGKESKEAKFWLKPVGRSRAGGFRPVELRDIERIIDDHLDFLLNAWVVEQSKRDNS